MNSKQLFEHKFLGVMNITPNSFSDARKLLDREECLKALQSWSAIPDIILDVGFESTAPFNQKISLEEELNRFHYFLEIFKEIDYEKCEIISIDSYRPEFIKIVVSVLKNIHPKLKIVFNDVSGIIDDQVFELLKTFPDLYYIYSATKVQSRDLVHEHMKDVIDSDDIINETFFMFQKAFETFKKYHLEDRLIIDPALGFSKTFKDNWKLIYGLFSLKEKLLINEIDLPILIGLSKKSFMQKVFKNSLDLKNDSEFIHFLLLEKWESANANFMARVHNPHLLNLVRSYIAHKRIIS